MSRFATISEEDLERLDSGKDSASTKRVIDRSIRMFREFLGAENAEFENLTKTVLNDKFRLFFAATRTVKGEEMKKSTMHNLKYGISRYMKDKCNVDISTDVHFESSRKTFKAKLTDLQKKGKGSVEHKKEISPEDMNRLMQPDNLAMNRTTPVALQTQVWFNIMYHLCRRGRENLRGMTKSTFAVQTDSSGREYVSQVVDVADKNHGCDATSDDTIGEARMYAQSGSEMCPVESFKEYIRKLHPDCNDLWQKPYDSFKSEDDVWYCNSPLGKNTLNKMMGLISSLAKLSDKYTNHCIRATSISALDRAGFEARHIIRASGHKSELSVKSYACRLTESTKRRMSDALNNTLTRQVDSSSVSTEVPSTNPIPPFTTVPEDLDTIAPILPIAELSTEDLDRIFSRENDFEDIDIGTTTTASNNMLSNSNVAQNPPQTINLPQFPGRGTYNVTPQMQNCVVHFHFNGN